MNESVLSPIDLRSQNDAYVWASEANVKRPWRNEFFDSFVEQLQTSSNPVKRVLELGSGPGFLAEKILSAFTDIEYVALDFSPAMHAIANERLKAFANRITYVERDFLDEHWFAGLGQFDCVVTNQAVHELRHKSRAPKLHQQVRRHLLNGGVYLVCDHYLGEDGMQNNELYMTPNEQNEALLQAGFKVVKEVKRLKGLVLQSAQ